MNVIFFSAIDGKLNPYTIVGCILFPLLLLTVTIFWYLESLIYVSIIMLWSIALCFLISVFSTYNKYIAIIIISNLCSFALLNGLNILDDFHIPGLGSAANISLLTFWTTIIFLFIYGLAIAKQKFNLGLTSLFLSFLGFLLVSTPIFMWSCDFLSIDCSWIPYSWSSLAMFISKYKNIITIVVLSFLSISYFLRALFSVYNFTTLNDHGWPETQGFRDASKFIGEFILKMIDMLWVDIKSLFKLFNNVLLRWFLGIKQVILFASIIILFSMMNLFIYQSSLYFSVFWLSEPFFSGLSIKDWIAYLSFVALMPSMLYIIVRSLHGKIKYDVVKEKQGYENSTFISELADLGNVIVAIRYSDRFGKYQYSMNIIFMTIFTVLGIFLSYVVYVIFNHKSFNYFGFNSLLAFLYILFSILLALYSNKFRGEKTAR